jgi:hypothetical protein
MRIILILFIAQLFFQACNQVNETEVVRKGIYFWKTDWHDYYLDDDDDYFFKLKPDVLYFKFFEIEPDEHFVGVPIAKTGVNFRNNPDSRVARRIASTKIVPVVFIQNEVFKGVSNAQLDELADNTFYLIEKIFMQKMPALNYQELQLDCDWTESTRDAFFYFIEKVKSISGKKISCTLRLYPYKYRQKMGVPPVDRVTLMCYNLISPLGNDDRNSILEPAELEKYLEGVKKYPVPMDVALPVFSYVYWYRYGQFMGLLRGKHNEIKTHTKHQQGLWHLVVEDFTHEYNFVRSGDVLKIESVSNHDLRESIRLLQKHVAFHKDLTISLFHLDAESLSNFEDEELFDLYSAFSNCD